MPTVGCIDKDPEIDINVVFNESRDFVVDTALSNSFAFGGLNSVIILRTV
jgi:nodulation protein E